LRRSWYKLGLRFSVFFLFTLSYCISYSPRSLFKTPNNEKLTSMQPDRLELCTYIKVCRPELNLPRSNITSNRLGYGSPPFDSSHRLRRVSFPLHQPHRRRHICLATHKHFFVCPIPINPTRCVSTFNSQALNCTSQFCRLSQTWLSFLWPCGW